METPTARVFSPGSWPRCLPAAPHFSPCIQVVRTSSGLTVTKPKDVLEEIASRWQTLFTDVQCVDKQAFFDAMPPIVKHECSLPSMRGKDLRDRLLATKNHRAVALDGWRMLEIKDLPPSYFAR